MPSSASLSRAILCYEQYLELLSPILEAFELILAWSFHEPCACRSRTEKALAASQEDREKGKNEGISAARGLQAYWSCQLGEPVLDIFVAKFSRALGPGCVDIVAVGEHTLFTLREQGTVRLQKVLGYQPACACKYTVVAAPGEEGERLAGTTVREIDEGFAAVVEEENLIIAADTDQLMVYKVRENRNRDIAASEFYDRPRVSLDEEVPSRIPRAASCWKPNTTNVSAVFNRDAVVVQFQASSEKTDFLCLV